MRYWLLAVKGYAAGKRGTLYWRHPPKLEIIRARNGKTIGYRVYSRLVISDKPVIYATLDDLYADTGTLRSYEQLRRETHHGKTGP